MCYTVTIMAKLLFGTAGIPISTPPAASGELQTIKGIQQVAELGLDCMELEFVNQVYLKKPDAEKVAKFAKDAGIALSAHAPYALNFNAREPQKIRISQSYLFTAAEIAYICGAKSIIFHPAYYMGDSSEKAYQTIKTALSEVLEKMVEKNINITLRPEVSGKSSQFGTIAEIAGLCSELPNTLPCVDFAHWHARTGAYNSYTEFASILDELSDILGKDALDNMHIHVSGIEYTSKGEKRHLPFEDSDMKYKELLQVLKDYNVSGMLICESPIMEKDALLLQNSFNSLP
ncbi:MAG: TIM barrel protein [Dehalococcoidales bacterium]|nr:TIM barrel protein [Dehalococcoidales bacterium]